MLTRPLSFISKIFFYPLWDVYDKSDKLRVWKSFHQRQWDSYADKKNQQLEKLKEITTYAQHHCPFYRKNQGLSFDQWPLLTKQDIRDNGSDLISDEFSNGSLVQAKTGGSTGTALEVYFDVKTQEKRNAMALFRDGWSGWDLGDARGALWGNPPWPKTIKEHIRNSFLDRLLYLDTAQMTDTAMATFLMNMRRYEIPFLFGHAHSLFVLAKFMETHRLPPLLLKGVISTSMMLIPSERKVMERVFQVPVTNRYGCEEVSLIASECEKHEGLHVDMDMVYVEFLRDDGTAARPGEDAHIVVTDLENRGMPLIRYKVGDVGVLSHRPCSCGRPYPLMDRLVGRTADFLVRRDGTLVAGVSLVERTLTAIPGLAQMQIVQERISEITVFVVPDLRYTAETEKQLIAEIKRAMGQDAEVSVQKNTALNRERNGKYRFAICKVKSPYQKEPVGVPVA